MVTALITGGTGFLGSHISRTLIAAGHHVRVLRRPNSPITLIQDLPVEHMIGDIMDANSLDRAMQGCEWVFHVAAISDYWRSNRVKLYLVNVNGTTDVLEAARRAGVHRVIFTSSGLSIGFREDGQPANEDIAFNQLPSRFPYGHSKALAEIEVRRAVAYGQDVVILNPSLVLGPGDLNQISGSAVVEIARGNVPIYPTGGATFIDVRDVAAAHLSAAERGRSGERYILGTLDISHKAMLKLIAQMAGVPAPSIPIPPSLIPVAAWIAEGLQWGLGRMGQSLPIDANQIRLSARNIYFDCRKAWRELGEPRIDIRQSLQETYDWYVDHGFISPQI